MTKWNPYLDIESSEFYNTVFTFAREKIFPSAEERDEKEIWDPMLWKEIGNAGLAGLPIPEEYGGQSATCFQSCLSTEAFASGSLDGGLGLSWAAHMIIGAMPIVFQGSQEQKKKYLPKLASGEWIAGLALTEPEAGSDAGSLSTKAEKVEGGYILNGSKIYITNGPVGQLFIVMARTGGKSRGPMGVSAFIVESDYKGFSVSKVLRKLGHHTSMTAELVFEDMFVPDENLLGPLNSGFMRIGKATLEWERTVLIAGVVGAMEYALDASIRYAKERKQFGKSIDNFYAMKEIMVRNWIFMNASRNYVYTVAKSKDEEKSLPRESSILKLFTSEVGEDVSRDVIQLFGGYGFMREYHIERMFRDLKLGTIGGGTSEIQRSIIASTFRSAEEFLETLGSYNKDIPGWELENKDGNYDNTYKVKWNFGLDAIKELGNKRKDIQTSQSFEFALADLILILSVIDCYRMKISQDTNWYSEREKIRDSYLAWDFLIEKYVSSLIKLSQFTINIQNLFKISTSGYDKNDYSKQSSLTERVEDCFSSLEKWNVQ